MLNECPHTVLADGLCSGCVRVRGVCCVACVAREIPMLLMIPLILLGLAVVIALLALIRCLR